MTEKNYPSEIELSEAVNTWGCHYTVPGSDKIHYGFSELPESLSLWLSCVSGDAVSQLLYAGQGQIILSVKGAYGGEKRTIRLDVAAAEKMCRRYWDKVNAANRSRSCHYCGSVQVVGADFFDASVCAQCSS
jgi:hypothetical protein